MLAEVRVWRTKEAVRSAMDIPDTSALPRGIYVLMRPDGQVDGFVSSFAIRPYLAHKLSMEVTPEMLSSVTYVCGMAANLLNRVPNATPGFVLEVALAATGHAADELFKLMCQLVFRGELFQYHLFDSVEPAATDY